MAKLRPQRPAPAHAFKPGKSGNPGGRKPLPPEIKAMRYETLHKAVGIMHEKAHDSKYIAKLRPGELVEFLTLIFDRCGLPKVAQTNIAGEDGDSKMVKFTLSLGDKACS